MRDAFAANFAAGRELGASLCVGVDGVVVADLWGGWATADRSRPWQRDTVACAYSCTKGVVAMAVLALAGQGLLDLDAPVATVWPEFAAAGKAELPLRFVLTHEAGLPAIATKMPFGSLSNWEAMAGALAAQEPWWEPGTAHGYHGVTFGHLAGEPIRRATGNTVRANIERELVVPAGAQFSLGLDPAAALRHDIADAAMLVAPTTTFFDHWDAGSLGPKSYGNPPDCNSIDHVNSAAFRNAEIPAANGITNARGLEALYRHFSAGAFCSESLVAEAARVHVDGHDRVMELRTAFGLGFEISIPEFAFGPGPRSWGHNGSGGSLGMVDPDASITFGYVMNNLQWTSERADERWDPIFAALYGTLG